MSQGDFNQDSPWAWTDATIGSLMKELEKVKKLVKKYPNNMELGKNVRAWYYELTGEDT